MTVLENTTLDGHHGLRDQEGLHDQEGHDHTKMEATLEQDQRTTNRVWQAGRFFLHFLEMLLAMFAGMALFHFLYNLIPDTSSYAVLFGRGTTWHAILMNVFMIVPMVAWMIFRGHGWIHSIEMAAAMVAPVALVGLLCQLGFDQYLPWLDEASGPAMFLGMLAAMLYRRDHYTGRAGHAHSHSDDLVVHSLNS